MDTGFLRTRRCRMPVIMPMVKTADAAFVRCCFQTPFQEGKACLRPSRAILWCAAWFCWNKAGHFFQQENRPKISPFCIKSSHVFRRFHRHDRFLRGDCQPFHQPSELLRVNSRTSSGVRGHWNRLSESRLYNRSHPSPSHTSYPDVLVIPMLSKLHGSYYCLCK